MQPEASQAETISAEEIEEIVKGLREQVVVNEELINEALDEQYVIENQMIVMQEAINHCQQDLELGESQLSRASAQVIVQCQALTESKERRSDLKLARRQFRDNRET